MISLVLKVKKPLDSGSVVLPFMSMSGTEGQDFLVVFLVFKTEWIFTILVWNS